MNLEQANRRDWATRDAAHILENSHTAQVLFSARVAAGALTRLIDALMAQVVAGEWDVASAEEVRDVLAVVADKRAATGKIDAEQLRNDVLNTVLPVIEIAILMLHESVKAEGYLRDHTDVQPVNLGDVYASGFGIGQSSLSDQKLTAHSS